MSKKKLNNKGFAVSAMLYTLLTAFLLFLGASLAQFSSSAKILSNANKDLTDGFNIQAIYYDESGNEINTYYVSNFPYDVSIQKLTRIGETDELQFNFNKLDIECNDTTTNKTLSKITFADVKSTCKGASSVKLKYTVNLTVASDVELVYKLNGESYNNTTDLINAAKDKKGYVYNDGSGTVDIEYKIKGGSTNYISCSYSELESKISEIKSNNNNLEKITVTYNPEYIHVCTSNVQNVVAGSLITCDKQKFYVLSNNGTSVKTIAQYALKKQSDGNYKQGTSLSDCTGVQFDDGTNGNVSYKPASQYGKYYGYWKNSYSTDAQKYNLDLNISKSATNKLISNYVSYLRDVTNNINITGDLMDYSTYSINYNYSWFPKNTNNGWLKTVYSNRHVYVYACTTSSCNAGNSLSYPDYYRCATPVITFPSSIIE